MRIAPVDAVLIPTPTKACVSSPKIHTVALVAHLVLAGPGMTFAVVLTLRLPTHWILADPLVTLSTI